VLALALFLPSLGAVAGSAEAPAQVATPACEAARVQAELSDLLQTRRYADAHQIALTAQVFCPAADRPRWQLGDAVALFFLDDPASAEALAAEVASGPSASLAGRADVLRAWMAWRSRDEGAFALALNRLPVVSRTRLCLAAEADDMAPADCPATSASPPVEAAQARYRAARATRRPWLAGTLSAVIPGAGQVYAGSWQGAGVAFVLNAVSISATVELARHGLYASSALTGVAASFFYVGSIVNAADLARRRNDAASEGPRDELERLLVPERWNVTAN
jgi:hypothetical protein